MWIHFFRPLFTGFLKRIHNKWMCMLRMWGVRFDTFLVANVQLNWAMTAKTTIPITTTLIKKIINTTGTLVYFKYNCFVLLSLYDCISQQTYVCAYVLFCIFSSFLPSFFLSFTHCLIMLLLTLFFTLLYKFFFYFIFSYFPWVCFRFPSLHI